MKKTEELKKLGDDNLLEELAEFQKLLFKARFDVKNAQSKNHHHIKNYKRHIARIKTILKERNLKESNKK